ILLLVVFSAMSFMSIRYLIFYMCVSAPILAGLILNLKDERIFEKISGYLNQREIILNSIACIAGIYLIFNTIPFLAKYEFKEDTRFAFPKDAADFLNKHEIKGNIFNEYGFGGYLIWRLYPEKRVFIDGRTLEPEFMNEYRTIASADSGMQKSWEEIIGKYNISYIVMPPLYPTGEIYPIVERLIENDDWALVYNDHLSLIFVKKNSQNDSFIKTFIKDKKESYNTIIIQASARAKIKGVNPYYLIALGKVFYKMGRMDDARKAFLIAYERDPKNPIINEWLKKF
ncbi:MAG: tetratricopeptide repeat protein, partial [Nitrospirota bacterium]